MIDPLRLPPTETHILEPRIHFTPAYIPLELHRLEQRRHGSDTTLDIPDAVRHILEYSAQRFFSEVYVESVLEDAETRVKDQSQTAVLEEYYDLFAETEAGQTMLGLFGLLSKEGLVTDRNLTELRDRTLAAAAIVLVEHEAYLQHEA